MNATEFVLRVAVGTLCGVLIGFERARDHKNTGMHMLGLVGLGAALLIAVQRIQKSYKANLGSFGRPLSRCSYIGFRPKPVPEPRTERSLARPPCCSTRTAVMRS